jgi:hypothetical protein
MFQPRWVIFRENSLVTLGLHLCNEAILPEDDPAGLKHVGGSYSEYNINIVHLLVLITFIPFHQFFILFQSSLTDARNLAKNIWGGGGVAKSTMYFFPHGALLDFLTFEDGTHTLSRNVGTGLSLNAA